MKHDEIRNATAMLDEHDRIEAAISLWHRHIENLGTDPRFPIDMGLSARLMPDPRAFIAFVDRNLLVLSTRRAELRKRMDEL